MAPRRGPHNTPTHQDSLSPNAPIPPRSTSPSLGFTQFLTKPAKWFTRTASGSRQSPTLPSEPRPSFGSARKHKISQPTDPRPILDNYSGHTARSVLDLSIKSGSSADASPYAPSLPSSPVARTGGGGGGQLGDLRQISRKAWSKSADDLSKITTETFAPPSHSFQEKIAEYRSRTDSNTSPASPTFPARSSPTSSPGTRHPFPSIGCTPPSSASPVRTSPALSLSISSPVIDEAKAQNANQGHVHIRSHSFTPKLPSKLATPRFPQSPQRGGSHDREPDVRHVNQQHHQNQGQGQGQATPSKAHFGFGFISHKSSSPADVNPSPSPTAGSRQTTLLPPPIIIEPEQPLHEEPEALDPRRTSQIVFYSGFVNRFGDTPTNFYHHHHHPTLQLSKGWKPFKLELKGSKLYFYKPPNDRTAAIKELFPTCLVPPSMEDDQDSPGLDAISPSGERDTSRPWATRQESQSPGPGRKKRAYWGRRTHPDIVKDSGQVQKGSFEALVHEAVFATTFFDSPSSEEDEVIAVDRQASLLRWQTFASSILLGVPLIVPGGRVAFEAEFFRCCSYLVTGSKDDDREEHKSRVAWLLNEYLRFHGRPADMSEWEALKKEAIPDVSLSAEAFHNISGLPQSSSTQAMYHPSPLVDSGSVENSPAMKPFSPRPDDGMKMIPLLEALFASPPPLSSQHPYTQYPHHQQPMRPGFPPPPLPGSRFPWAILFEEGLTRDLFFCLDPHLVAKSLTLFHRSVLEQCPANVVAGFLVAGQKSLGEDTQPPDAQEVPTKEASDFLFGNDDHPHWLTKLLLLQILGAETVGHHPSPSPGVNSPMSPGGRPDDHHPASPQQTSRTHSRSDIISVWVKVGELCRANGDECSWRAIQAGLCSRPVARLAKVWKRVDPHALVTVQRWIFGRPGLDQTRVEEKVGQPQVTPWGGDIKDRLHFQLIKANEELMIKCDPLLTTVKLFESFRTSFELCPRKAYISECEVNHDIKNLVSFWREMANEGGGRGGTSKFQRLEQFMALSLAAEPRRKGLFEPYFWTKSSSNTPYTPLIPLLFPDPLPTLTLVDRSKLIRSRLDSDASENQHLRSLEAQLRQESGRQLYSLDETNKDFTKKLILGHGGTAISVYDGNLLLVTQSGGFESAPNSRPSSKIPSRPESSVDHGSSAEKPTISRNTSIRVKPSSSHGLERKTSMARRSSLPAVTHLSRSNLVTTEPSTDPPLRVLVQAGTLNNLVNILVYGLENMSVSVADDNGEMTLREGKTRELALDKVEFARVWWNVFRSFLTPYVFFELLRKIYLSHPLGPSATDAYNSAMKRVEVLSTLHDWFTIGSGAQDVLDDAHLFSAIQTFLDNSSESTPAFDALPAQQALEILSERKKRVQIAFSSQIQRPTAPHKPSPGGSSGTRGARRRNTSGRDVPDIDRMDPEAFAENLDGMASAAFSNVTEEDLYVTADLLEVQSADRTGWFPQREAAMSEDAVEIQTIYSHILEVEPSSLISELSQDSLYRLLPPGVRSCIRAYTLIRKWLISKLVAPRIGLRARHARIELLIQVIELARLKNTETPATPQLIEQACVRSFVEAVTTSALLSPEIRLHHRTWQSVALARNCNLDSLSSLLHQPFVQSTSVQESLTADVGWLLERMIEIIAAPDVLDASSGEGQQLINFDKRRHLCNLISKISCIPSERKPPVEDAIRRGFERLNIIEKEVSSLQFDLRGIKEEASREASNPGMPGAPSSRKAVRPFHKMTAIQIEKSRRDKSLRTRLQREKVQEQSRIERRDDVLNKAMRMRKQVPNAPKHRNKKSMSAFLNFMRPISSAFGAEVPHMAPKRSAAELDFPATSKPSLVINVVDARVAQFINNERSYTFQLDTEDGGHYLLQAVNKREMNKWLETISRVTNTAAKRRLTYIGNSPKPQIADHIHSHPIVVSRDPLAVFGVELEFLLRRETGSETVPPGTVPLVVEQCLCEIESRGLTEVGIYRIAGAATVINGLKDAYNRGEYPIQSSTDVHAICDLVKSWFRLMPEPLFPPSSYRDAMEAMRQENLEDRLLGIRNVVQALPQANLDLLRRVSEHLDRVTDFEECNHMTAEALAIVFSPNLLRAPQNDFVMILNNMGLSHKLVKALITHFHFIFDEAEPDLEGPSEDELDGAILEEEEEEEEEEGAEVIEEVEEEVEETHDLMQDKGDDDEQHTTDNGINNV